MKLIHLITTIERGGAEKQLITLISQQISNGHDITVFYLKGLPELKQEMEKAGSKVYGTKWTLLSSLFFVILRCWRSKQVHLIHAHLPAAELLGSFFHGRIPLVVTRHNTQKFLSATPTISKFLAKFVESQSQACIAISKAVKDFMIQNCEWKNPSTIFVVHYGIVKDSYQNKRDFSNKEKRSYLFVGRLVPQKDVQTLLRGFYLNQKSSPNDSLRIVGEGKQKSFLHNLSHEIGKNINVDWVGRVENVDSYYRNSDIFILPSKYEGFGLVLLEALLAQIPILAANNSAIPEVLGHGHPGLFRTGDYENLARLMSATHSQVFCEEILAFQNSRLSLFSPEKMEQRINDVYSFSLRSTTK